MKCCNCGTEFEEGIFCPECGTKNDNQKEMTCVEIPAKEEKVACVKKEKKRKFPLATMIIAGVLAALMAIGMFVPSKNEDVEENKSVEPEVNEVEVTTIDVDYGFIYGGIVDYVISEVSQNGGDTEYLMCALYDMNNDGYKEFIVENGTCNADVVYEIYTTDGETAKYLGEISGYCGFYREANGNGIYTDYCNMGYETITYSHIKDGSLVSEVVFEQETDNYGYYEGKVIEELTYSLEMEYLQSVKFNTSEVAEENALTYHLDTDVENGMLYSNEDGKIIDVSGNVIPEYDYLFASPAGCLIDSADNCVLEGYEISSNGQISKYMVDSSDTNTDESLTEVIGLRAGQYRNPKSPVIITIPDEVYSDGSSEMFVYIPVYIGTEGNVYAYEYSGMINLFDLGTITLPAGIGSAYWMDYDAQSGKLYDGQFTGIIEYALGSDYVVDDVDAFYLEGYAPETINTGNYETGEYILPTSDIELLTMEDIYGFSASDCKIARNEIYARHGRLFKDAELQDYFNSCSWYEGNISGEDFNEDMLSEIEKANRDLIIEYETEMGYR